MLNETFSVILKHLVLVVLRIIGIKGSFFALPDQVLTFQTVGSNQRI